MVFKECAETYKQPSTIIITVVSYDLFKNLFRLTPKNEGSKLRVFTVPHFETHEGGIIPDFNAQW